MKFTNRSPKITWWAPHWSHVGRVRRVWFECVFNPVSVLRVSAAFFLAATVIIGGLKIAFPLLQWRAVAGAILIAPGFYGYMWLMYLVHLALPANVVVRRDRVLISHGQTTLVIQAAAIERIRIVVFATDKTRLRIDYRRPSGRRTWTVGVARRVDLQQLVDLLPQAPQVWDARERYARRSQRPATPPGESLIRHALDIQRSVG